MKLHIGGPKDPLIRTEIRVTGSKSESNRALLLQALYPHIDIDNLSNSDDTQVMKAGLSQNSGTVDIHHAGTAMRFLTGFFASQEGKSVWLTGSQRMTERPIQVLVEALRGLGAEISYAGAEGYPPLKIKGKVLPGKKVSLPANISSQYISSLLLIAPRLPEGLELELVGKITSVPYIKMTLGLLAEIGVASQFEGNTIKVFPKDAIGPKQLVVESDWSSASYFYSIAALADTGSEILLSAYKKNSLQGDSVLATIYTQLGVETHFEGHQIRLTKTDRALPGVLSCDLANAPDIAQTIAVTCFGLGIGCALSGLHTLKIKETDRLEAMKTELSKFGADIEVTDKELVLQPAKAYRSGVSVATYNDHRMAMAFAPLAFKVPFHINDAEVVSKSYPDFWEDMAQVGFIIGKE